MKAIAEFVVRVADLVEAEGRSARLAIREEGRRAKDAARRLMLGSMCIAAAAVFLVAGLGLFLGAVYVVAQPGLGAAGAMALTGGVALLLTSVLTWLCTKLTSDPSMPRSKRQRAVSAGSHGNGTLERPVLHETLS